MKFRHLNIKHLSINSNQLFQNNNAIKCWGCKSCGLSVIIQPVLIVNGENDKMVPISNSYELKKRIKNSEIIVYKNAGHVDLYDRVKLIPFEKLETFFEKSLK